MAKAATISLRIDPAQRSLIDRAAAAQGKSRSAFILDTATEAAKETVAQSTVVISQESWDAFMQALESPPEPNPGLERLMRRKKLWQD